MSDEQPQTNRRIVNRVGEPPDFQKMLIADYASIYDEALSKRYSRGAKLKDCYQNAYNLMLDHENNGLPIARCCYMEGLVATTDAPNFFHGWVDLDGKIIDPTRHKIHNTKSYLADGSLIDSNCDDWQYVALVRMTFDEASAAVDEEKLPILNNMMIAAYPELGNYEEKKIKLYSQNPNKHK